MGTLLVGIIVAEARANAQTRLARYRIEACGVLSELLQDWWADPDSMPRDDEGEVFDQEGWTWRTTVTEQSEALEAEVVTVEVFGPHQQGEDVAAARVELLLPRLAELDEDAGAAVDDDEQDEDADDE